MLCGSGVCRGEGSHGWNNIPVSKNTEGSGGHVMLPVSIFVMARDGRAFFFPFCSLLISIPCSFQYTTTSEVTLGAHYPETTSQ